VGSGGSTQQQCQASSTPEDGALGAAAFHTTFFTPSEGVSCVLLLVPSGNAQASFGAILHTSVRKSERSSQ